MANYLNIPQSPFVDLKTGYLAPEWLQWITSPNFLTLTVGNSLGVTSGGTGTTATPGLGQILVGTGSGYTVSTTLPASATPAYTGDVSSAAGTTVNTLATVNANVGSWGSATAVASFTVNAKGLITAASNTNITGSAGSFTAVGAFGCNGKTAQTSAAVNAAITATAGAAYGATEQAMLNDIKALLNQIRAALVADGITV